MEIKPQAVVSPRDDQLEQGKYGPVLPRTPACYGFTVIATVKPGRADAMRSYGYELAKALKRTRTFSRRSSCTIFAGCFSTDDTRFMYQGIFDTDFDKYTEDAIALFKRAGVTPRSKTSRDFRRTGRPTPRRASNSFESTSVRASSSTESIPISADEIKKALRIKEAFSAMLDQMQ